MKSKWFLGSIFMILAVLGVNLDQATVPNQEIVVEFTHDEVATCETKDVIAVIKQRLQSLGIKTIHIQELPTGDLKITYHSVLEVGVVKQLFSEDKQLDVGLANTKQGDDSTNFPTNENSGNYELDVYEIVTYSDASSDFNGCFLTFELKAPRFLTPDYYKSNFDIVPRGVDSAVKVAYLIYSNNKLPANERYHTIPEVRAGPICKFV